MLNSLGALFGELKEHNMKVAYDYARMLLYTKMHDIRKEKYGTLYWKGIDRIYSSMSLEQLKEVLKGKYEKLMDGETLNYDNPKTFTEKIQWLKIYESTPIKTRLADKYAVRDWICKKIGEEYLVPLVGVWDHFENIDFSVLPETFCLKTNHGSGMNLVVKNKREMDVVETGKLFDWWLQRPFWVCTLEPHYKDIPRKIIAEKYIEEMNGGLYDYKFHCFHGEPAFIQCIGDRDLKAHTGYQMNFDTDWKALDWILEDYPAFPYMVPKPECLTEMLRIAKVLSAGFSYVRVDLYEIAGKVYFGEMTFTPGSGNYPHKGTWTRERDEKLGGLLQIKPSSN